MSKGPRYIVKTRRRREGKTDYRKRMNLLRAHKTRMVVRKTLSQIIVQFVEYKEDGDNIIASAVSKELKTKYKWGFSTANTSSAYITGYLAALRAKEKGIKECVLDTGRQRPVTGSKIFASLKGALDAGIKCPHNEEKLPSEDRIHGKHIDDKISSQVDSIIKQISGGK